MIPFPFNENWFSFFVADHLLVGQLCTNPKSDRSLLSYLKVTQCSTSEIRDAALYNSCLYWSKLWQQDHCQHPQNANPDGSTLEGTTECIGRPFGGGRAKAQGWGHCQEDPDQGVHWKGPGNHWWNSPAVWWSPGAIRWQTLGVAAGLGAGPQVQRDPGLASEGVLRLCTLLSLAPLLPRWTTSFGHTSRTSRTWTPITPNPAWSPPSAEYSPSSHRHLWKKHAPSSGSVLRLKVATLNRCQLYCIIKLPELIFSIKVLK